MSTDTTVAELPQTTGPDAVDYDRLSHVRVEADLLVYGLDCEHVRVQSDTSVTLEAMR